MSIRPSRRSSIRQIEVLLDKMEVHRDLALGKMRSKEARALSFKLWEDISDSLNCEGPPRTAKDWSKVWTDLKFRIKSKIIQNEEALKAGASVGDVKEIQYLSPLEERVAAILRPALGFQAKHDTLASQMEEETINEVFEDSNTSTDAASPASQESFPKSPLSSSSTKNGSKLPHNASSPAQHGAKFTHASSKRKVHDPPEVVTGKMHVADSRFYQLKRDDDGECAMFGSFVAKKLCKLSDGDRDVMMAKILQLFADERHNFSRTVAFPVDESTLEFEYVETDNR